MQTTRRHAYGRAGILGRILTSPDAYATTLVTILIDTYGTESLQWAPETTRMQLEEDFGVSLPQVCFDRLMAGVMILGSDGFYKSLPDFIALCNALGGDGHDPEVFDPADSLECAWGITEAVLLSPPDFDEDPEPFAEDIRHYIGAVLRDEGFVTPPDVLKIALQDAAAHVDAGAWGDDPELGEAIWQRQADKAAEVDQMIKENLEELLGQLEGLPLSHGSTRDLPRKLIRQQP